MERSVEKPRREAPERGPSLMPEVLYHATTPAALRWVGSAGLVPDGCVEGAPAVTLWRGVPPRVASHLAAEGRVALVEVDFSCLAHEHLSGVQEPLTPGSEPLAGGQGDGWEASLAEQGGLLHADLVPRRAVRRVASVSLASQLRIVGALCGLATAGPGRGGEAEHKLLAWVFGDLGAFGPEDGFALEAHLAMSKRGQGNREQGSEDALGRCGRTRAWREELSTRAGIEVFDFGAIGSKPKKAASAKTS